MVNHSDESVSRKLLWKVISDRKNDDQADLAHSSDSCEKCLKYFLKNVLINMTSNERKWSVKKSSHVSEIRPSFRKTTQVLMLHIWLQFWQFWTAPGASDETEWGKCCGYLQITKRRVLVCAKECWRRSWLWRYSCQSSGLCKTKLTVGDDVSFLQYPLSHSERRWISNQLSTYSMGEKLRILGVKQEQLPKVLEIVNPNE